jgi:hypothetical protein
MRAGTARQSRCAQPLMPQAVIAGLDPAVQTSFYRPPPPYAPKERDWIARSSPAMTGGRGRARCPADGPHRPGTGRPSRSGSAVIPPNCHCRARPGNPDFLGPSGPVMGAHGQGLDCRVKPGNDRRGRPFTMPSRLSAAPGDGPAFAPLLSRYPSELSLPGSTRQSRLPWTIRPYMRALGKGLDCRVKPGNDRRARPFTMPSRLSAAPGGGPAFRFGSAVISPNCHCRA